MILRDSMETKKDGLINDKSFIKSPLPVEQAGEIL